MQGTLKGIFFVSFVYSWEPAKYGSICNFKLMANNFAPLHSFTIYTSMSALSNIVL